MFNRALIIYILFECIFAQATSVLPIGRADGTNDSSQIPDGYYNIAARDANSGNGGFRLTNSNFVGGGQWKLQVSRQVMQMEALLIQLGILAVGKIILVQILPTMSINQR